MEDRIFLATLVICAICDARKRSVPEIALLALLAAAGIGTGTHFNSAARVLSVLGFGISLLLAPWRKTMGPADVAVLFGIALRYGYVRGSVMVLCACTSAVTAYLLAAPPLSPEGALSIDRRFAFIPHLLVGVLAGEIAS